MTSETNSVRRFFDAVDEDAVSNLVNELSVFQKKLPDFPVFLCKQRALQIRGADDDVARNARGAKSLGLGFERRLERVAAWQIDMRDAVIARVCHPEVAKI